VSRSVDLFVSSDAPVEELAATIAARGDLTLDGPADGGGVLLGDGSLSAVLHQHAFVDDGDIVVSRYRYALSLHTTVTGHLGVSAETAFLRRVAATLGDHRVLLVLDLQYRTGTAAEGEADR
jgi:hypothetical protein